MDVEYSLDTGVQSQFRKGYGFEHTVNVVDDLVWFRDGWRPDLKIHNPEAYGGPRNKAHGQMCSAYPF